MTPEFIKAVSPLYDMSNNELVVALDAISPNRNLVANYISQDTTNLIHNISVSRLDMISSMVRDNNSSSSMNYNNISKMSKKLLSSPTRSNLINQVTKNLDHNLIGSDKHYIWFTPFGQLIDQDRSHDRYGYQAKTGGVMFGYDYKMNNSTIGGIALGYYKASFDHSNDLGKNNKINSVFATIYGSKKLGEGYINGSLVGSYNRNNLNREIHIREKIYSANSKHNSNIISPRLEMGYNLKEKYDYQVIPFVASEYTMEFNKGYSERGGEPLNMRIKSARNDIMTSELGVKLRKTIRLADQDEIAVKAKLSYINKKRFRSRNKISSGFTDQVTYYQSKNYSRSENLISPGAGLELKQENGLKAGVSYNGEIGKKYKNHEAMLQIGYEF